MLVTKILKKQASTYNHKLLRKIIELLMKGKLNKLIAAVNTLTERLTVKKRKLDSFETKYDALNAKITKQEKLNSELETELDSKIPYQDHYDLLGRI